MDRPAVDQDNVPRFQWLLVEVAVSRTCARPPVQRTVCVPRPCFDAVVADRPCSGGEDASGEHGIAYHGGIIFYPDAIAPGQDEFSDRLVPVMPVIRFPSMAKSVHLRISMPMPPRTLRCHTRTTRVSTLRMLIPTPPFGLNTAGLSSMVM